METLGTILLFIGLIPMLVGSIWLLVTAFQESILWGLGTLLVPFVGIIFVIMHWDAAKKPFLIWAAGFVPYVIGMILAASAGVQ